MKAWTRWQDWVNVVAGAWLFVAPWLLGTAADAASSWNAWLLGLAIIVVGLCTLAAPRSSAAEWINALLGAWVFVAPWLLGFGGVAAAAWNAWVAGLIVIVLALWALPRAKAAPISG